MATVEQFLRLRLLHPSHSSVAPEKSSLWRRGILSRNSCVRGNAAPFKQEIGILQVYD